MSTLKNILRGYRIKSNEDPFALYQEGKISKGKLLEYIIECIKEFIPNELRKEE